MTIPFSDQMMTLVNCRTSASARTRLLLLAEKLTGAEALRLGLVDAGAENSEHSVELAVKIARENAEKGQNHQLYRITKERMVGRKNLKLMLDWRFAGDPNIISKL